MTMKALKAAVIALALVICGTFVFYKMSNANNVPFRYVLRTFVPEAYNGELTNINYIIESEEDFESFLQKFNIDAVMYDKPADFTKNIFLVISYYGARPYYTYSQTIESIRISGGNLQFTYNKDMSNEIFANYYMDNSDNNGLAQRYTAVIMVSNKYLKYAKDFTVFKK